jgi:SAM-dependent methyltransferase
MTALADILLARSRELVEEEAGVAPDPAARRADAEANAVRCAAIAHEVGAAFAAAARRPRVLEVGIGYAYQTSALRHLLGGGFDLHAIEHPRRRYLDRPEFRRLIAEQHVELERCDLLADPLPWPELDFDAVVFADVIEHLPPTEVPRVLDALGGRLSPSGRLIITSTNLPAVYRLATLAAGNGLIFDPPHPLAGAPDTYGHIRLYGRADMEILLQRAGLRLASWRYGNWELVYVPRDTRAQRAAWTAQKLLPAVVPRWSTSWLLAAERAQTA